MAKTTPSSRTTRSANATQSAEPRSPRQAPNALPELSLVVPMYNEAEGMHELFARVIPLLEKHTESFEIVCINDGSRDGTLEHLRAWHKKDARIKVVDLSRNFGKELALTAGLDFARGLAVIPFDADLQDPPEVIPELLQRWRDGYKVVLATRSNRPGDSWFKRRTAGCFYSLINRVSHVDMPANTGDFRLMDRQVVEEVKRLRERTRFMKGVFAWVGFPTATVYYERPERFAGQTSWNYRRLWQLALDGLFSFTTLPLKVWTYVGASIALLSMGFAVFLILRTLLHGTDVPGYASLMVTVLFLGGMQLMSLGIIGEYIARIYRESKQRPLYVVHEAVGFE